MNSDQDVSADQPRKKGGKCKQKTRLPYQAQINSVYHRHSLKQQLSEAFAAQKAFSDDESGAVVHDYPFKCLALPKFVKDEHFLEGLKNELLEQIFYEKSNDLYKFQQSEDLKKMSLPHVKALRKLLYEDFLDWLREVTNIDFTNKIDMTCSKYEYTDVLLCHDDELEGRRVAFILYLVPPWKDGDGGTLDLFDMDDHYQPKDIVKSLTPEWNRLVFFEVTPASHHQVAEVLTRDKTRLSVSGWFHGPSVPRPEPFLETPPPTHPYNPLPDEVFLDWINPIYLDPEVQGQIQEKFENDSEIELQGFLKEEKYMEVIDALRGADIRWARRGPPNKRNYDSAVMDNIPEVIQQCLDFLQSEAMFLTLSNLTGLTLHPLATNDDSKNEDDADGSYVMDTADTDEGQEPGERDEVVDEEGTSLCNDRFFKAKRRRLNTSGDSSNSEAVLNRPAPTDGAAEREFTGNPRCRAEIRKWSHNSYTLVHDSDTEGSEFALDAMLFCFCKGWQSEFGGYTSYIAKGEDEELLTVNPAENSLALVYRDKDTLKFVKHVNQDIEELPQGPEFYDFSVVYYE